MKTIPIAKEFIKDFDKSKTLNEAFREFAKLHVKAALEAAVENAKIEWGLIHAKGVDKQSILNAYPETNIK